jgi:hypothetical protein
MKTGAAILLATLVTLLNACNTSTQPESTHAVTMKTDSAVYTAVPDHTPVLLSIHNSTDSTILLPACGPISFRVDTFVSGRWSLGSSGWTKPCLDIYQQTVLLTPDSSCSSGVFLSTSGQFRIVTVYGLLSHPFSDTVYSNQFTVQ